MVLKEMTLNICKPIFLILTFYLFYREGSIVSDDIGVAGKNHY